VARSTEQFDELVCGPSVRELVEAGYLADARILTAARPLDLSDVKRIAGDFSGRGARPGDV
jgi:hypothetical protein